MKRKMWVVVVISVILVFSGWLVATQLQKQTTLAENRHHIFCEKLVKGMNKHEVLTVLRESGEFEYGQPIGGNILRFLGTLLIELSSGRPRFILCLHLANTPMPMWRGFLSEAR